MNSAQSKNRLDKVQTTIVFENIPKAVLFDLDGTLVDSAPDLHRALNNTLEALGLKRKSEHQVGQWIGNGVNKLLHRGLTDSMDGTASGDDFWRARSIFNVEYEQQSGQLSKLYSGVKETLEKLSNSPIFLVCITNKDRRFTLPLLKKLELFDSFDEVVCGDDLSNKKPHPEPLLYAAKKLSIAANRCVMVGDSASDVGAANAAKMPMICVDYGYNQGVDLNQLKINAMISDIRQIELLL